MVPALFTYREVYWLKGTGDRRGTTVAAAPREKPFATIRWVVTSNDARLRSPGMDSLGDTKQLQLRRGVAEFIEKLVRPPMGADLELKNEPSSIILG